MLQGPIPVQFDQVFSEGAYASGPAQPIRDYERSSGDRFVQSADKQTGELLWVLEVIDADPEARNRTVKVKITGSHQPVLPAPMPGSPFIPIELEGMSVTPYVNSDRCQGGKGKDRCGARIAYSFKATGIRAPAKAAGSRPAADKDAA